jgi:uncharacterized membrane protein YqjE
MTLTTQTSVLTGLFISATCLHTVVFVHFLHFEHHQHKSLSKILINRNIVTIALTAMSAQCYSLIYTIYFIYYKSSLSPFINRSFWALGVFFLTSEIVGHSYLLKMRIEGLPTAAAKLLKAVNVTFALLSIVYPLIVANIFAVAFIPFELMITVVPILMVSAAIIWLIVCLIDIMSTVAFVQFAVHEKSKRADLRRGLKMITHMGITICLIGLLSLVSFVLAAHFRVPLVVNSLTVVYFWGQNVVSMLWMTMKIRYDEQHKKREYQNDRQDVVKAAMKYPLLELTPITSIDQAGSSQSLDTKKIITWEDTKVDL